MFDSDDINNINLNKVCRSCLTDIGDMKSLYDEYSSDKFVADVFMSITSLEFIGYYDGLPTQICCDCFLELNQSYKYVLKCRESDKTLRLHLDKVIKKRDRRFVATKQESNVDHLNAFAATVNSDKQSDRNIDFDRVYIKTETQDISIGTSELLEDRIKLEDENLNSVCDESLKTPISRLEMKKELAQEIEFVKHEIDITPEENSIEIKSIIENEAPIDAFDNHPYSYRCQHCNIKFPTYMLLLCHYQSAKHKDFELCRFCSTYHESHKLYLHMRLQHKHRIKLCEISDKTFVSADTSYLRTSTDEKYSCKICCRTFYQKGLLSNHIRLHTRDKPYACHICDHTYNHKVSLKRHLRSHGKETK